MVNKTNRRFCSAFSVPELASYSFDQFIESFWKHEKSSVLSRKFHFGKRSATGKGFFLVSAQSRVDELIR